jgi:hypothetical protein
LSGLFVTRIENMVKNRIVEALIQHLRAEVVY